MPLKIWCSIHARWSKSSLKHSIRFCGIFSILKHNFIASSKMSDCIFEIHLLWQFGFSRVYSNSCCSCSFEPEIIKISQSSHKMYSNNILNFQESTATLDACTKNVWKLIEGVTYSLYISYSLYIITIFKYLYPNYSIVDIGQNSEQSPWELTWLAVTQTLVKKIS